MISLSKYHALGNDYLLAEPAELDGDLTAEQIRRLCDRHYGIGSDGLLLGPLPAQEADFGLRLFNPDGGEFEKSGNGLRIFARYLWDRGLVTEVPFTIHTPGGVVRAQVGSDGRCVTVAMGQVSFHSRAIPVAGPPREVLSESMAVAGRELRFSAATIGNPHCIIVRDTVDANEARALGPVIEQDPRFPNRTNVQFVQVLARDRLRIEIWERGAGYTLASGSSSCAAAAVAHRLGLCDAQVEVSMPGGVLEVAITPDWTVTLTGPVTRIADVVISAEIWS